MLSIWRMVAPIQQHLVTAYINALFRHGSSISRHRAGAGRRRRSREPAHHLWGEDTMRSSLLGFLCIAAMIGLASPSFAESRGGGHEGGRGGMEGTHDSFHGGEGRHEHGGGFREGHHRGFDDDDDFFFLGGGYYDPFYYNSYPYRTRYVRVPAAPAEQYWNYCPDTKSYYPYV